MAGSYSQRSKITDKLKKDRLFFSFSKTTFFLPFQLFLTTFTYNF